MDVSAARYRDRPMLFSYQSDAWSCRINESIRERFTDALVYRRGKLLTEFLMERSFFKVLRDDGSHDMHMHFAQPRGLALGKGASQCFNAACQAHHMLRKSSARLVSHTLDPHRSLAQATITVRCILKECVFSKGARHIRRPPGRAKISYFANGLFQDPAAHCAAHKLRQLRGLWWCENLFHWL